MQQDGAIGAFATFAERLLAMQEKRDDKMAEALSDVGSGLHALAQSTRVKFGPVEMQERTLVLIMLIIVIGILIGGRLGFGSVTIESNGASHAPHTETYAPADMPPGARTADPRRAAPQHDRAWSADRGGFKP